MRGCLLRQAGRRVEGGDALTTDAHSPRGFYDPVAALAWLLPGMQRLDGMLGQRVTAAARVLGPDAAADPYRGLHVTSDEASRLLDRPAGTPPYGPVVDSEGGVPPTVLPEHSAIHWLAHQFGLSAFDLDVMFLALAPELDLRYERVYAYLQDDVTRRRPSVDLALNVFCGTVDQKLAQRTRFAADAPLLRHGLVSLQADPAATRPPLLAHALKLDEQIVSLLLGQRVCDHRLAPLCVEPNGHRVQWDADPDIAGLGAIATSAHDAHRPFVVHLRAGSSMARRGSAESLARETGLDLLHVHLGRATDVRADDVVRLAVREAWLQRRLLYLDGFDDGRVDPTTWSELLRQLASLPIVMLVGGVDRWRPPATGGIGVVTLDLNIPDVDRRQARWLDRLAAIGADVDASRCRRLAGSYRLELEQIDDAIALAGHSAAWRNAVSGGPSGHPTVDDLAVAARAQAQHDLDKLAFQVDTRRTWADLVLPATALTQLGEICARVRHRSRVLDEWGFDGRVSVGRGVSALFVGPSGTGKTMAAEVIAGELGLDLYKIDLAGVVSKYIGETEKNLDRIFATAEHADAILFFDEADALFGKRSEVRDSHDRYANIETAYLLQRMEQYEGIAILATNLRGNLDEAFTRRIAFTVYFPFPEEAERRRIWQRIWPDAVPRDARLDLDAIATRFRLSGGHIRNVALGAAFLAAADGEVVRPAHVLHAVQREYEKMGRTLSDAELEVDSLAHGHSPTERSEAARNAH